uniref:Uncharacterized protein n=1 Tax=Salix viminalis TaxID=40686 RepID=A0A6N2MKM4_SALVM
MAMLRDRFKEMILRLRNESEFCETESLTRPTTFAFLPVVFDKQVSINEAREVCHNWWMREALEELCKEQSRNLQAQS